MGDQHQRRAPLGHGERTSWTERRFGWPTEAPIAPGQRPLNRGLFPPATGTSPLDTGTFPPASGTFPPGCGSFPLDRGSSPPGAGTLPPGCGSFQDGLIRMPAGMIRMPAGMIQMPAGMIGIMAGVIRMSAGLCRVPTGMCRVLAGMIRMLAGVRGRQLNDRWPPLQVGPGAPFTDRTGRSLDAHRRSRDTDRCPGCAERGSDRPNRDGPLRRPEPVQRKPGSWRRELGRAYHEPAARGAGVAMPVGTPSPAFNPRGVQAGTHRQRAARSRGPPAPPWVGRSAFHVNGEHRNAERHRSRPAAVRKRFLGGAQREIS